MRVSRNYKLLYWVIFSILLFLEFTSQLRTPFTAKTLNFPGKFLIFCTNSEKLWKRISKYIFMKNQWLEENFGKFHFPINQIVFDWVHRFSEISVRVLFVPRIASTLPRDKRKYFGQHTKAHSFTFFPLMLWLLSLFDYGSS